MTSAVAPLALAPPDPAAPAIAWNAGERARTRALFAACYAVVVFLEAAAFQRGVTSSVFRFTPGDFVLWACIDGAAWWACVALAERGWRLAVPRPLPYVVATIAAAIVATRLHLVAETWYFAPRPDLNEGRAWATIWMLHLIGLWRAALVSIAYYFRVRSRADAASLHVARVEQAALARREVEARLRVLQGRVDPRVLFESLAQVERLCEAAPDRADRILEALIAYLRAALPDTGTAARTLADELALAEAYVALVRARADGDVALVVDVVAAAREAAMPPMLLLPLVEAACERRVPSAAPLALTIAALVERNRLRVVVAARGQDGNPTASDRIAFVRRHLAELFGAAAALVAHEDGNGTTRMTLELPDERTERHHR